MTTYREALKARVAAEPPKCVSCPECYKCECAYFPGARKTVELLLAQLERAEAALEFAAECIDTSQTVGIKSTDKALASLRAVLDSPADAVEKKAEDE